MTEPSTEPNKELEYCFTIRPILNCDPLNNLKLCDERENDNRLTGTIDMVNIVNGKFTEYFTLEMIARLSEQL